MTRTVATVVQEDALHALERAVVEACAAVDRSTAALMGALWEFRRREAFLRLGFPSFRAWAESDRFPYDASTASQLLEVYETFVMNGGIDAEEVARVGWSKLHRLKTVTRRGLITPKKAVALAKSRTQAALSEDAYNMRAAASPVLRKLPLFDVRIELSGAIYLHRRLRERDAQRAVDLARRDFRKEDLFGFSFERPVVRKLDEGN